MVIFHERLKALKEVSGKTQVQIAEDIGIPPQNLSYYFNGREPNFELLIKLAQYFKVSTDYLLGLSDIPYPDYPSYLYEQVEQAQDLLSNIQKLIK